MKLSMLYSAALVFGAMVATQDAAASSLGGTLSGQLSIGTLSVVASPLVSVAGSAQGGAAVSAGPVLLVSGMSLVVSGLVHNADMSEILLSAVGSVGQYSVKLSAQAARAVGLSVGATVQVLADSTGTILVTSGKVLAFIPNAMGEALLSQQRLPAP